jgi:hypothetical protein
MLAGNALKLQNVPLLCGCRRNSEWDWSKPESSTYTSTPRPVYLERNRPSNGVGYNWSSRSKPQDRTSDGAVDVDDDNVDDDADSLRDDDDEDDVTSDTY